MTRTKNNSVQRGRPRSFDPDKALDAAMRVFWSKGYEGASLSELESATGLNRPSLYAAFGNKESLFQKALKRYSNGPATYILEAANQPTARQVAELVLRRSIEMATSDYTPVGCMVVRGALSCDANTDDVRKAIFEHSAKVEKILRDRFKRAIAEGDLRADADPKALARYLQTVMAGLAVQATMGAPVSELTRIAKTALRGWPE